MSEPDTCANCGRPYKEHQPDTRCFEGQEGKWFPNKLAQAIIDIRQGIKRIKEE